MPFDFKLPDVGEGIHEGEIVRWIVSEGDRIEEDQPVVEVQTDKAVVEIPSPKAGVVEKLHYAEGDVVDVGNVLITIDTGDGTTGQEAEEQAAGAVAESYREGDVDTPAEARRTEQPQPPADGEAAPRGRVLATPATRRLARELGVAIQQVRGTGPAGRVTAEDVRGFAEGAQEAETAPSRPTGEPTRAARDSERGVQPVRVEGETPEERIAIRGVRKRIMEKMVQSKHTAPHVTHMDEVEVTELVRVRSGARDLAEERGVRLTYLPFIMKALVAGLREYPDLNATVDDEAGEIVRKGYYNIGVATDTDEGLIVPVVKHADQKSMLQIAAEIVDLSEKARNRRVALEDLQGGTFTITNIGALGGLFSTPIINHPEVGILGVHRIREQPVVRDGQVVVRPMLPLALSFDHRIVDGAYAARFLNRVMRYLEQPSLLFMELI